VPSWSSEDDIVLLKLNVNVDDTEDRKSKSKKKRRQKSWYESFDPDFEPGSDSSAPAAEKRFFETNDQVRWENHSSELNADNIIGTVQKRRICFLRSRCHFENAYSEFNIFVKFDSNFKQTQLDMLTAAFESGTKPILIDPNFRTCRTAKNTPSINARLPLLGWPIGPWKRFGSSRRVFICSFCQYFLHLIQQPILFTLYHQFMLIFTFSLRQILFVHPSCVFLSSLGIGEVCGPLSRKESGI